MSIHRYRGRPSVAACNANLFFGGVSRFMLFTARSFLSQSSMPIVRIKGITGTTWPFRVFFKTSEMLSGSIIPSELLTMCWLISTKSVHSVEMVTVGARARYAFRFLFRRSCGTMSTNARRIRERRWPGRTSCSRGTAYRNSRKLRSRYG